MPNTKNPKSELSRALLPELLGAASHIARFKLARPEFGSARNISGIRTKTQTFSQRHDSRTIFAFQTHYGYKGRAGAWTGPDKRSITECRRVLKAAGIPPREVQDVTVVSEMGRVAERTSENQFRVHEATVLRKLARASRNLEGVPVWSSYATVGLTRKGDLGSLELHWPEISEVVIKEAKVLQLLVKRGFKAPELPGAQVESVQAGVIHSPAIGFFMDITPCIRAIYRGQDPAVGRKPVLYIDRHGNPVSPQRDIEVIEPPEKHRPKPVERPTQK